MQHQPTRGGAEIRRLDGGIKEKFGDVFLDFKMCFDQ